MDIARELIEQIAATVPDAGERRIATVIRPPGRGQEKVSPFTVIILDNGSAGVSYNIFSDESERAAYSEMDTEAFIGSGAFDVAAEFASSTTAQHRRIVGFAAVNALSQYYLRFRQTSLDFSTDILDVVAPAPGEHVVMVGLFKSLPSKILGLGAKLTVIERDRTWSAQNERFQIVTTPDSVRSADVVMITSSCLLNGTMEEYLHSTVNARAVAVVGPGASVLPDPFFRRNVMAVGGNLIIDAVALADRQRAGLKWGDAARKYFIHKRIWQS